MGKEILLVNGPVTFNITNSEVVVNKEDSSTENITKTHGRRPFPMPLDLLKKLFKLS